MLNLTNYIITQESQVKNMIVKLNPSVEDITEL